MPALKSLIYLSLASLSTQQALAKPANIIFVLVDDMGWGDMQHYHQKHGIKGPSIQTPNLDNLARNGVQLTRHYTAAPVSAPARASFYTGMHQGQATVVRNSNFDAPIENAPTVASVLRAAGYRTALIGKWGVAGGQQMGGSPHSSPAWPTKRGFDFFFGYGNHRMGHRHYPYEDPHQDPENRCNAIWEGGELITPKLAGCYSTDLYTARAKEWIIETQQQAPEQAFFLTICHTAPHARLALPAMPYPKGGGLMQGVQWYGQAGKMINTANHETWDSYIHPAYAQKNWPLAAKRHATMITRLDQSMGDLVQLLIDLNIDKNTYIIFTSDNGAHDEYGAVPDASAAHPSLRQDPAFFRSYGMTDGIKRDVWEGGIRVPCIVYAPTRTPKGLENAHPTQFHDWMATFADIAGCPSPARSAGRSLLPLLSGKAKELKDNIVYTEFFAPGHMTQYRHYAPNKKGRIRGEQQAFYFRDANGKMLKAIRTNIQKSNLNKAFEVYDTLSDPQETKNLAPSLGANLQEELRQYFLHNRLPYNYVQEQQKGKSEYHYTGKRPYAGMTLASIKPQVPTQQGLSLRQAPLSQELPWLVRFDTLAHAAQAQPKPLQDASQITLPAGTLSELSGYINIPETGAYQLDAQMAHGGQCHIRLHNISLEGKPLLQLAKGLHPITITLSQSRQQDGQAQLLWATPQKNTLSKAPATIWAQNTPQ